MRHETIEIILFHDKQADSYEVSARIGGRDVFLRRFADGGEAASFIGRWVRDRGYDFALGSGRRVDQAQRTDACVLVLHCERRVRRVGPVSLVDPPAEREPSRR